MRKYPDKSWVPRSLFVLRVASVNIRFARRYGFNNRNFNFFEDIPIYFRFLVVDIIGVSFF